MTETVSKEYTDQGYADELREIRERLLLMAGRVEAMISESVDALVARNSDRAESIIKADHEVNQDEIDLDRLCLEILALRQPMASDLRFVAFTLKMVTDLERIGDLAVNICERAIDLSSMSEVTLADDLMRMGGLVQSMVRDAIDAFVDNDQAKAEAVIARDDGVDELYHHVFREMLDIMCADSATVARGIHIQSVAKVLERMADHSTNLAEQVVFMLQGTDIRHEGKL